MSDSFESEMEEMIREKPIDFLEDELPDISWLDTITLDSGKIFVGFFDGWAAISPGRIGMTKEDIRRVDLILAEYNLDQEDPNVYIGTDLRVTIDKEMKAEYID